MRRSAIRDLTRLAEGSDAVRAKALPLLATALSSDEEPSVRTEAATALADLRAEECLPTLLVAVEDPHSVVGQMALAALGEIGDCRALPRIERAARDARPEMRYQAAIARARMVSGDALVDALADAISDDDPNVRYIGLRLVEERMHEPVIRDAVRSEKLALGKKVHDALEEGAVPVTIASALVLARAGDRSVVPQLLRVARREVKVAKEDEEAVLEMLGALGVSEARPILETRAFGLRSYFEEGVALAARIALARLGDARARRAIEADLASTRIATKTRGAVAAGRAHLRDLKGAIENAGLDPKLLREILTELEREEP